MTDFWDVLKKNITQGIKTVSAKTDELTQIGRLKIQMIALKRDIEKSFVELGGRVYHQLDKSGQSDLKIDDDMKNLVKSIREFEKRMKTLEKDISKIQSVGRVYREKEKAGE